MTVTIHLPERVERAYQTAASDQGVSIEALLSNILLKHAPTAISEADSGAEMILERGIPVLRTGQPLELSTVNETLNLIRHERESAALGLS